MSSWEDAAAESSAAGLSASAKPFSFNPSASGWTPPAAPAPEAPAAAAAPAPALPAAADSGAAGAGADPAVDAVAAGVSELAVSSDAGAAAAAGGDDDGDDGDDGEEDAGPAEPVTAEVMHFLKVKAELTGESLTKAAEALRDLAEVKMPEDVRSWEDEIVDEVLDEVVSEAGLVGEEKLAFLGAIKAVRVAKPEKVAAAIGAGVETPKPDEDGPEETAASAGAGAGAGAGADAGSSAPAKSGKAEIVDEYDPRPHLNVVFIGHVDAGKSTLSGQVLLKTGQVDARTIEKFEREAKALNRESWFLAFIMDTNEEERAKGKTVEVGRATFETSNRRFTILDAPGHKNYVPNMIQGASQADVGVLVISARKGEFETGFERGGQTREHAMLAKTLGVRFMVVVINKMDDPTVKWSEKRYSSIVQKLTPFLKSAGYNTSKHVFFLPISAMTGTNIDSPVGDTAPWFEGKSLLGTLDELVIGGRNPDAPLRMPVLDQVSDRGVIALGKIEAGTARLDDKVIIMPTGTKSKIDKIYINDVEVGCARPGENVRMKLKGVSDEDVHKGFVVCAREAPCHAVHRFKAQLMLLELGERALFTAGYNSILHVHTCTEEVTVTKLLQEIDKKSGKPKPRRPVFVKSQTLCVVELEVPQSVCVETFSTQQQMGRFTLREEGRTIAIGKILEVLEGPSSSGASAGAGAGSGGGGSRKR